MNAVYMVPMESLRESGAVLCAVGNVRSALVQIESGALPHYDENCRNAIGEELILTAVHLSRFGEGPMDPRIEIPGLRLAHLPGDLTLEQVRQILQVFVIRGVTP